MIITENVHCISTFFTNQYLIVDGHTLFLIDTGLRGNAAKIIRSIYAIGHHPSALKQTFITHADGCLLYTSRAHETPEHLVCRLLLEKKKNITYDLTRSLLDLYIKYIKKNLGTNILTRLLQQS